MKLNPNFFFSSRGGLISLCSILSHEYSSYHNSLESAATQRNSTVCHEVDIKTGGVHPPAILEPVSALVGPTSDPNVNTPSPTNPPKSSFLRLEPVRTANAHVAFSPSATPNTPPKKEIHLLKILPTNFLPSIVRLLKAHKKRSKPQTAFSSMIHPGLMVLRKIHPAQVVQIQDRQQS